MMPHRESKLVGKWWCSRCERFCKWTTWTGPSPTGVSTVYRRCRRCKGAIGWYPAEEKVMQCGILGKQAHGRRIEWAVPEVSRR